jgi:peroxiredoxin/predicted 2-oxoglutarate/Fe(II)-dependent dioxygenase YbiX
MRYINLQPGDPAPWFYQRSATNPRYAFDTVGGRYLVLCFFGSASDAHSQAAITTVMKEASLFDDTQASFFGVSNDRTDESQTRLKEHYPGYRYFYDFDGSIGVRYGALPEETDGKSVPVRRMWVIIDPTMRVQHVIPFAADQSDISSFIAYMRALPPPSRFAGFEVQAPVLILPNVFEPAFCQQLIDIYHAQGGEESGFMREVAGKTVMLKDHHHKRRKDCLIKDESVIKATQERIIRRVVPEIQKVHQFKVTRMERYIVCCYAAEDEAHFNAHRDNTTKATEHRRFAVSINLNDEFDGGEVCFPEYGPRSFKAPPGGAVVFSCSLLHAVSKVTRGSRYAFLPFLYDDEAARLREANNKFLGEGVAAYRSAAG